MMFHRSPNNWKILGVLVSVVFLSLPLSSFAHLISPPVKDLFLSPGDIHFGEITFTNTSEQDITVSPSVSTYDPQTQEYLQETPILGVKDGEVIVPANSEEDFAYTVSVPQDQPEGTYFNLVVIVPDTEANTDAPVSLKAGFGSLVAIHVTSTEESVESLFFKRGTTELIVTEKGLPNLSPTQFTYSYTNESDFVFKPEGEIRVIDSEGKQIEQKFDLNKEGKTVYPGETLELDFEANIWDFDNVLGTKDIVSRTYSGFGTNFVTNKTTISLLQPILILSILIIVVIVTIVTTMIIKVVKKRKSKKEKAPEK